MLHSYNLKSYKTVIFEIEKGEKHGIEIAFRANGDVNCKKHWKSGKKHGEEIYFWMNGNIRWEKNWIDAK